MRSTHGTRAIHIYRQNAQGIDCVVLELIMPDMTGGVVYDRLVAINPKVKVLLFSGYSLNDMASEILDRGCNRFIRMPFDILNLYNKIREILETSHNPGISWSPFCG